MHDSQVFRVYGLGFKGVLGLGFRVYTTFDIARIGVAAGIQKRRDAGSMACP